MPFPVTVAWLLWLAAVSVWLEALPLAPPPPPPPSADIVDLAQWRLDHPANGNGPTRGRAA